MIEALLTNKMLLQQQGPSRSKEFTDYVKKSQ